MDIKDNWDHLNCAIKREDESECEEDEETHFEATEVKAEVKEEIFLEENEAIEDDNEEDDEPFINLIGEEEDNDTAAVSDPLALLDDFLKPSSSSSSSNLKLIKIKEGFNGNSCGGSGEELKCPKCNKPFAYPKHLQNHLANHANYEFPCLKCNKMFYKTYNLKRHLSICPMNKKYNDGHLFAVMCKLCGKGFKKQSLLKEHLAGIHGIGERRKFGCEKCGKNFTQKKNLHYHQQVSQNCS